MVAKLERNTYPSGLTASDFKCYGPPAETDADFTTARLADLGCFSQEEVDSNKYYHACMCTDKDGKWYVYVEFGREGAGSPQYQWFACNDENDARKQFIERCAEKNTKRGKWDTVAGLKMFVPKPGKDLYRVRKLAKRSYGLPDAKNITIEGAAPAAAPKAAAKKPAYRADAHTTKLLRDLLGGAVTYTRSTLEGGTIPIQSAIDEGRSLLGVAKQRIAKVGDSVDTQIADNELKQVTYALYSRIPKKKRLHCPDLEWILSQNNILQWEQDLSAFETALTAGSTEHIAQDDPMDGMPLDMEWVDPNSELGQWLYKWWPAATRNVHGGIGSMKIKNLWKVSRHGDDAIFGRELDRVQKEVSGVDERPLHQDKKRPDLDMEKRKTFWQSNVGLLFHGTRSVNVPGILRTNLRLPAQLTGVVITGAMFGDGLYWADDWKKSAGYTSLSGGYWSSGSGAVRGRDAFMFVADVLLGIPHVAPGCKGYTKPPPGHHSVFGKAGHSGVHNNEWIVYQGGRNVLRYLIEFTT